MRGECHCLPTNDGVKNFTADAVANFFHRTCCVKNMIRERLASSKKCSDVPRGYVSVLRHTVAKKLPPINLTVIKSPKILAVKFSTNVYWNRVATDRWKSIVESGTKKQLSFRTIEDSEQTMTLLLPINNLSKDCLSFNQSEQSIMIEVTLNRWNCKTFNHFSFYNVAYLSKFMPSI